METPRLTGGFSVSADFVFGTATFDFGTADFQIGTDTVYGILTDTLKKRWAAFVGECHAASGKFVLPQMV